MGSGFSVECAICGWKRAFTLGIGMAYFSPAVVLAEQVHWKQRDKILALLNEGKPDDIEYSHQLYLCPKCSTLHQRFYINMRKEGLSIFETRFKCRKCRSELRESSEEDVASSRCGRCGQQALTIGDLMMWD